MKKTPLAIFTYNRPAHTHQTFEAVARCRRFDECDVVIFCDGLKKEEHRADVEATRALVQTWGEAHQARIVVREQNLGLKKSIETGVGELCQQYGRIIVLEDDIVVSEPFIDFMLSALDHYEHDERVMQVSGFTYPFLSDDRQGAILLPPITSWGWATWQRVWQHYNPDPTEPYRVLQDRKKAYSFELNGSYPYIEMLAGVVAGKTQSWAVLFWYTVWSRNGLVAYPRQSLVGNVGFDGTGVNCGVGDEELYRAGIVKGEQPVTWPFPSHTEPAQVSRLYNFYQAHFMPSSLRYQLRRFWGRLRLYAKARLQRSLPIRA